MSSQEETYVQPGSVEYHQASLKEGYRGLAGAIAGLSVSEAILFWGGVGGDAPLIFVAVAAVFSIRHILHIRQTKDQIKRLSGSASD